MPYFVHLSAFSVGNQFVAVSIVLYTCKPKFCNGSLDVAKENDKDYKNINCLFEIFKITKPFEHLLLAIGS